MASVQGDDAGCAESLGNCDEPAVGAAEVLIGLLVVSAAIRVQSAADSGSTRISPGRGGPVERGLS